MPASLHQKWLIANELEKRSQNPQPYLRAAASQTLEMIAIGDFIDKARTHPDQIDDIRARLNYMKRLDELLWEEQLQLAAQSVLDEIDKIMPEKK